jgi:post-segregation antitoxin (ccd killing protein)
MSDVLTIPLSPQVMAQLADRASAQGVDIATLATRALCREAARPLLDDLLKPVRDAFAQSGMTDDELSELLEVEKHQMRGVPYEPG